MKRGFTLIEMLVVVAVLATLMTMVFRLSSIGGDTDHRTITIDRLQRLENCLSGYYAAFGSYPPVKLHGSRSPYLRTDVHGVQTDEENTGIFNWTKIGERAERDAWRQVQAACRAQPIACNYPYPDNEAYRNLIVGLSDAIKQLMTEGSDGYTEEDLGSDRYRELMAGFDGAADSGRFSANRDKSDWRNIQLFRFGLMSYLLPRYLVMMNGTDDFFNGSFAQWSQNNVLPCDPFTGQAFSNWQQMKTRLESSQPSDVARLANIPSQAVCARWMPNLAGIVGSPHAYSLFGVDIQSQRSGDSTTLDLKYPAAFEIFSPGGADSTGDQYVLDGVTVKDGWYNEFYYYSPAPYQKYTLWSAGPNGRTFPPWISRARLNSRANECVVKWTEDDIIHMSN